MAPLSDEENDELLKNLSNLFHPDVPIFSGTDFRDKRDTIKNFDSKNQSHIDQLNETIRKAIAAGIEKQQLHELANFMREQGSRFDFVKGRQLKEWIEILLITSYLSFLSTSSPSSRP